MYNKLIFYYNEEFKTALVSMNVKLKSKQGKNNFLKGLALST
jgi:hypothetical protein